MACPCGLYGGWVEGGVVAGVGRGGEVCAGEGEVELLGGLLELSLIGSGRGIMKEGKYRGLCGV